ncbi:MAG: (d)CMP kinase [Desulfobacteraceae bacterium]|nr:(d)CMP kinase [Desulfobacteraceae bacterium]MCB9494291.1 (d)CMP kinase [Desulfobacteraceae bacterium]
MKTITIDGPAAAGKTTLSRIISEDLGFVYVDTGAIYRALAFYMKKNNIDFKDEIKVCKNLNSKIRPSGEKIFLNNEDVSNFIRTEEISMGASIISSYQKVRDYLLDIQRNIGKEFDCVFEGRDMGTKVFPMAQIKFYLDADIETRARRRFNQLKDKGENPLYEKVYADLEKRDSQDMKRKHSPLKPASDAFLIDSTLIGVNEVREKMIGIINSKWAKI